MKFLFSDMVYIFENINTVTNDLLKNLIHFIQKREKSKAENIAEKMIKRNLLSHIFCYFML